MAENSLFQAAVKHGRLRVSGSDHCFLGHRAADDGIFAEWSWDGQRLTVRNDRYGMYPLFYCVDDDGIMLAPSVNGLLARGAPRMLDDSALAVFLRLGYFLGDDTPFASIKAVPPGGLTWDGTLRLSERRQAVRPQRVPRKEAISLYAELFREAVRRRPPAGENFTVPLSGGRDSRHILFTLCELGYRPKQCVTAEHLPPRANDDAQIAALVCERLGIEHVVVPQSDDAVRQELEKNNLTHFCADEHAWYMPLAKYLAGNYDTVYDGIGGDVLSAGLFSTPDFLDCLRRGECSVAAQSMIARSDRALACVVPAKALGRFNQALAMERLEREIERHVDTPNPVASLYFWTRTRREIALAPYGMLGAGAVYSPYLDREVFDFLFGLPGEYFTDHRFHTDAINEAYPQYADIPYERKGARRNSPGEARRYAMAVLRFLANRNSKMVRKYALALRLLVVLVQGNYDKAWWDPLFMVYLLQLDGVAEPLA